MSMANLMCVSPLPSPPEHDDRMGGPQFRNRRGRGSYRGGRPFSDGPRPRHRGGFGGPGPRARFEDDGDVAMNDGNSQDGGPQRRL